MGIERSRLGLRHFCFLIIWVPTLWSFAGSALATKDLRNSVEQLVPVTLQLKWRHQFQFAGYYVAQEKGYYRTAGLDVTILERAGGDTPLEKLIRDEVDFAVADAGALIYRSAGVPLVALAAIFQHSPSILLTHADAGINEINGIKGKRVRLSHGYNSVEILAMLENEGIGLDDMVLVPSTQSLDELIARNTDAVNAYLTNEPYRLQGLGVPFKEFHPQDYGVDFYGDILVTMEKLIDQRPGLVERFREASLKGWRYAVEHPKEAISIIEQRYNSQSKTEEHLAYEADVSIGLIMPNIVPVGYMHKDRWIHIEKILRGRGLIRSEFDLDGFIYSNTRVDSFFSVLYHYRLGIGITTTLLALIFMLLHILSLRALVNSRTSELREAHKKAESDARTDALTGLPNRRHFMEVFTRDVDQSRRQKTPLTVIVGDLDRFKKVNDTYGHGAGDEALRMMSQILKANTRRGDFFARLGGEEFVIVCPCTDHNEAKTLADRCREALARQEICYDGQPFKLTISMGVAAFNGEETPDELLNRADMALYEAKQLGRNKTVFSNTDERSSFPELRY